MTTISKFSPTCLGAPLVRMRSLTTQERDAAAGWLAQRRRASRGWGLVWTVLAAIPCGIPLLIGASFIFGTEQFHLLLVLWASLLLLACLIGWAVELTSPTSRWMRYFILGSLLSGGAGIALNSFHQGTGDLLILPLLPAVMMGFAFFFLRTLDRSKLVRPSKVRKDLRNGEVWEFSATQYPSFDLLPASGLILRQGDRPFPSPLPALIQMAAAMPTSKWEIPAHFLQPSQEGIKLFTRSMAPQELEEGHALLRAHTRKTIPILVVLGIVAVASAIPLIIEARQIEFSKVPWALRIFAGYWGVLFIWTAPRTLRLRSRMKSDLVAGRLVVVRPDNAEPDSLPIAEVMPVSRVVWSYQGGIGPMRRKYAKTMVTRQ